MMSPTKISPLVPFLCLLLSGCVGEPEDPPTLEPVVDIDDAFGGKADAAADRVLPDGPAPAEFANQITLFAIPSPRPAELSWKSPGKLVRRVMFSKLGQMTGLGFSRSLGHAGVRIECGRDGFFQGSMTNVDGSQFNDLLMRDRIGLGMLFDDVDGRLERAEELEETLLERYDNGRVSFLRIGISEETCRGLIDYVHAYETAGVQSAYGLAARPLYREGAGCSAFSMSFLELANLIEPRYREEWSFSVRVPKDLVGGTMNPGNEVGLWRLFLLTRGWAEPDEEAFEVSGWDPTLMFHSIRAMAEEHVRAGGEDAEARGRAIGLVLDRRSVEPTDALLDGTFFYE
jgi:hypothetical protein